MGHALACPSSPWVHSYSRKPAISCETQETLPFQVAPPATLAAMRRCLTFGTLRMYFRLSSMHRLKPIVARTPEELAGALGLSRVAAKEWQVQHVLLGRLKEIARRRKITHAEIAKRAGTSRTRVTAILNDDIEHVSSDLLIRILASLGYRVKISVVRSDTAA